MALLLDAGHGDISSCEEHGPWAKSLGMTSDIKSWYSGLDIGATQVSRASPNTTPPPSTTKLRFVLRDTQTTHFSSSTQLADLKEESSYCDVLMRIDNADMVRDKGWTRKTVPC